jgi:hypothetical protein
LRYFSGYEEKELGSELGVQLYAARTFILQVNLAFTALAPTPVSGGRPSSGKKNTAWGA